MADPIRDRLVACLRAIQDDRHAGDYDYGSCAVDYRIGRENGAEAMLKAYDEATKNPRADHPPGERRLRLARRKSATRRR